mmetsp:Transcript_13584/g.37595  ORF Transcript_13584/g.37595 Transcript_13584/m.37595 type:complete len:115 (-) Transcript_13584:18-362(-)
MLRLPLYPPTVSTLVTSSSYIAVEIINQQFNSIQEGKRVPGGGGGNYPLELRCSGQRYKVVLETHQKPEITIPRSDGQVLWKDRELEFVGSSIVPPRGTYDSRVYNADLAVVRI